MGTKSILSLVVEQSGTGRVAPTHTMTHTMTRHPEVGWADSGWDDW